MKRPFFDADLPAKADHRKKLLPGEFVDTGGAEA